MLGSFLMKACMVLNRSRVIIIFKLKVQCKISIFGQIFLHPAYFALITPLNKAIGSDVHKLKLWSVTSCLLLFIVTSLLTGKD